VADVKLMDKPHNMPTPLVTIVVSCFNHAKYIEACVDSILRQSYAQIELIVIDDGSTDGSAEILKDLAARHGFYFEAQANQGLPRTLNKALAMANGKYFCPMGSDDVMLPEKTALQVEFLEAHPEVGFCCGNAYFIDAEGRFIARPNSRFKSQDTLMGFEEYFGNRKAGVIAPSTMIRTELLREIGGYDVNMRLEDAAMWLRITWLGHKIGFIHNVIMHYRKHPTNTSKNLRFMYESLLKTYEPYKQHPRYLQVFNRFLITTFITAAKRRQLDLAVEALSKISPRYYNWKVVRGLGFMARAYVAKPFQK